MKSTLRTRIATAALLLAPVAALVAAQPAAAQPWGDRAWGWGGGGSSFDRRAPQIFDITPGDNTALDGTGVIRIGARFRGVDPAGVTLRVNGLDRTALSELSPNGILFSSPLPPGRYNVDLTVRNRSGVEARGVWSFTVIAPGGAFGERPDPNRNVPGGFNQP